MDSVKEEVEVINSIYDGAADFSESMMTVELQIPETSVEVRLWIPGQYPDIAPRVSKISGIPSGQDSMLTFQNVIDETFVPGEVYLFTFIDEIREEAQRLEESVNNEKELHEEIRKATASNTVKGSRRISEWSKSEDYRDKTSVFVGHAMKADTEQEMEELVEDLLCDKKLSNANINMVAWRIKLNEEGTQFSMDYDNDGESGAGTCMLHVLEMANVQNAVVVVSRFFDGTHIGPDRFKHIKNCTRDALVNGGFINK